MARQICICINNFVKVFLDRLEFFKAQRQELTSDLLSLRRAKVFKWNSNSWNKFRSYLKGYTSAKDTHGINICPIRQLVWKTIHSFFSFLNDFVDTHKTKQKCECWPIILATIFHTYWGKRLYYGTVKKHYFRNSEHFLIPLSSWLPRFLFEFDLSPEGGSNVPSLRSCVVWYTNGPSPSLWSIAAYFHFTSCRAVITWLPFWLKCPQWSTLQWSFYKWWIN